MHDAGNLEFKGDVEFDVKYRNSSTYSFLYEV